MLRASVSPGPEVPGCISWTLSPLSTSRLPWPCRQHMRRGLRCVSSGVTERCDHPCTRVLTRWSPSPFEGAPFRLQRTPEHHLGNCGWPCDQPGEEPRERPSPFPNAYFAEREFPQRRGTRHAHLTSAMTWTTSHHLSTYQTAPPKAPGTGGEGRTESVPAGQQPSDGHMAAMGEDSHAHQRAGRRGDSHLGAQHKDSLPDPQAGPKWKPMASA